MNVLKSANSIYFRVFACMFVHGQTCPNGEVYMLMVAQRVTKKEHAYTYHMYVHARIHKQTHTHTHIHTRAHTHSDNDILNIYI